MAAHLFKPPPRPSELGFPPALDEVIAIGLAKDPDHRYPSADALAQAARVAWGPGGAATAPFHPPAPTLAGPLPGNTPGPTAFDAAPSGSPVRRKAALVAGALGTVVLLVAGLAFAFWPDEAPSDPAPVADSGPPPDTNRLLLGDSEVNTVMGRQDMVTIKRGDTGDRVDDGVEYAYQPADCEAAVVMPDNLISDPSVRQLRYSVEETSDASDPTILGQYVVEFDSVDDAAAMLDRQVTAIQGCAGSEVKEVRGGHSAKTLTYHPGEITREGDTASTSLVMLDAPQGHACQRVLTRVHAYLVYMKACDMGVTDQARVAADRVAAKITSAKPSTVDPPLPELADALLDADQVSAVIGQPMKVFAQSNGLNRPSSQATVPSDRCLGLVFPGSTPTYSAHAWRTARLAGFDQTTLDNHNPGRAT